MKLNNFLNTIGANYMTWLDDEFVDIKSMIHGKVLVNYNFIYLFLATLGLPCCPGFLVVASGGCSPVAVCRLLIAVASPVAERGLQGA